MLAIGIQAYRITAILQSQFFDRQDTPPSHSLSLPAWQDRKTIDIQSQQAGESPRFMERGRISVVGGKLRSLGERGNALIVFANQIYFPLQGAIAQILQRHDSIPVMQSNPAFHILPALS